MIAPTSAFPGRAILSRTIKFSENALSESWRARGSLPCVPCTLVPLGAALWSTSIPTSPIIARPLARATLLVQCQYQPAHIGHCLA